MYLISHQKSVTLIKLVWYLMQNKTSAAINLIAAKSAGDIPAAISRHLLVPCQGRCPKECSQGIDENTKDNCTYCNGWGFVEGESDPWIYDIELGKAVSSGPGQNCMLLTSTGKCISPCQWSPPGEISEDGFWLVWNRSMPDFFDEVRNPVAWMPSPKSKDYPDNGPKEQEVPL